MTCKAHVLQPHSGLAPSMPPRTAGYILNRVSGPRSGNSLFKWMRHVDRSVCSAYTAGTLQTVIRDYESRRARREAKVVHRKYFNQTTWRTLAVLEALSNVGDGKTLSELRDETGCSKSSLFPILKTIEDAGFIRSNPKVSRYVLSPKIFELVRRHSSKQSLTRLFDEYSRPFVDSVMETMQMAVLDGTSIVYVAKQESNHPVRLVSDIGRRLPSHATALGKCLLSGLSNAEVSGRFEGSVLEVFTNKTVSVFAALLAEIERTRAQGYAEDWQEVSEGLCCVAAPIFDGDGEIVAAVSFSVPQHRATPDHWRRLRQSILECASSISARLGYVSSASDSVGVLPT